MQEHEAFHMFPSEMKNREHKNNLTNEGNN